MKLNKIVLILFLSTFSIAMKAQEVTIKNDGKVGIGTTEPIRQLEISGVNSQFLRVTSTNAFPSMIEFIRNNNGTGSHSDWRYVNSGNFDLEYSTDDFSLTSSKIMTVNGATKRIGFGNNTIFDPQAKIEVEDNTWQLRLRNFDPGGDDWWIGSSADTWNIGRKRFVISPTISSLNAAFVIDSAKNIGIGTIDPKTKLHVIGGADADANTANTGSLIVGSATGAHIAIDGNEIMAKGDDVSIGTLYIQNNGGLTRINGEVGLGMAPFEQNRLSVNGDVFLLGHGDLVSEGHLRVTLDANNNSVDDHFRVQTGNLNPLMTVNEYGIVSVDSDIGYLTSNDNYGISALNAKSTAGKFSTTNTVTSPALTVSAGNDLVPDLRLDAHGTVTMGGDFRIFLDDNNNGLNRVSVKNSSNIEVFNVDESGKAFVQNDLRIGTNYLPSGYGLGVDGKIICEELKVQLFAQWPDYVFKEDYELTPLNKLEEEIKSLGHLPGIPSAEEVESSGIEVGEMQRLTLEKIEELTLYIIELQKSNENLQKQILEIRKTNSK